MEFKFSTVIDPETYETDGLCDGIPLRRHHNPEYEDMETLRCQEDWRKYVGPLGVYKGGLSPRWNFMAVTIPECLPERLGLMSYANELGFLHDDVTDVAALGEYHNDEMITAFEEGANTGNIENSASGKRAIQNRVSLEMLKLHKEQAITTMKAWAKFAEMGSGRQHQTHFKSEADYIAYRLVDVGTMFWYGMVTFCMGISIPHEELDLCHELANTAYLNLGLTNDLYSWQKEYETAVAMGQDFVVNIIYVLMKEHSISEEEAKELTREKIKVTIIDFRRIVAETKERTDISGETKRYLEALQYSLSGNLVWSKDCPRYQRGSSYNERQLDWMKNGVPKPQKAFQQGAEMNATTTNTEAPNQNGSLEAKTPKTNGLNNGLVSNPTSKLTSRSTETEIETANGNHSSSDFVDNSLVNVFTTKTIDDVNGSKYFAKHALPNGNDAVSGMKSNDKSTNPSVSPLELHPEVVLEPCTENLDSKVIEAPYDYISSLPSKGIREKAIDALDFWCHVPAAKLDRIKLVTTLLHNASLMLDDVEDGSNLRRGKPSTHTIFGTGQTVNSANYQIIRALEEVQEFGDVESLSIFTEELKSLYIGQSMDLYWTGNMICPSVDQYLKMVESKTGGLFRLFGRLMALHSTNPVRVDWGDLLNDLGKYFQTRDDYQNLMSQEYTKQKGFCEDLDEGKYSLPLIHLILSMPSEVPSDYLLRNILTQRLVNDGSSLAHKETIIDMMKNGGSLKFTAEMLDVLHSKVENSVEELEKKFGAENLELKMIVAMLKV